MVLSFSSFIFHIASYDIIITIDYVPQLGGVERGQEGVGVNAPIPPGGAPMRAYKPREITWTEFQKEFDDKYRSKMYRDKKRIEFLNLVQGDDQKVEEYELHFAALAKYTPEAVATQEDRHYHF
ncbi:hypothetical protein Sango_2479200 [Sesamum angolense]|uniref:Retrotransposon gag domain-containing protein n=1 Tax=Sesamum angolense TaxID=2727404 RepID=A0AAE1W3I9_9LAMI|nr:hypothetical protein Sango_2479200 [Sesamum angolense]